MSEPLWARDPDAVIAEQKRTENWLDTYGGGCGCFLNLALLMLLTAGIIGGLVVLFR